MTPMAVIGDADLLLDELVGIETGTSRIVPPAPTTAWDTQQRLAAVTLLDAAPDPIVEDWWDEATGRLAARIPNVDSIALDWFCDVLRRNDRIALGRPPPSSRTPLLVTSWLGLWIMRRPVLNAGDRLGRALSGALDDVARGRLRWHAYPAWRQRADEHGFVNQLRPFRDALRHDPDAYSERAGALVERALAALAAIDRDGLSDAVLDVLAPSLWESRRLSAERQRQILLARPCLAGTQRRFGAKIPADADLRSVVGGLMAEAVRAGSLDPAAEGVLLHCDAFAGIAQFLAAARWLDRPGGGKDDWWTVRALRLLAPPDAADAAQAGDLAMVRPATLQVAAMLNSAWAALVERARIAPDLDGVTGLALWLRRFVGPSPWALDLDGNRRGEWDLGAIPSERAAFRETVTAMGAGRVRKLLKHPLVQAETRVATFLLAAILGENAAEVEEKFLKRDKWAVVALGMLPDEGDVPDRYLALRRFAQEARRFGPQRGVSEALAVQIALAHLAVTGGFADAEALEWAIEGRLATEVDPVATRWSVGGYDLWVESEDQTTEDQTTILVERGAKLLKSVPAVVRRSPEYAEAKEARDRLLAQTERVRRRLERAMVRGDCLDRVAYDGLLALPAGRRMLPRLVLLVRSPGAAEAVEVFGQPVTLSGEIEVRVVHPLHLAAAGSRAEWQRRVVADGVVQPVDQLFRGLYLPTAAERASQVCRRFQGRRVELGRLRRALLRSGWEAPSYYAGFVRRFVPPAVAELTLEDYVAIGEGDEPVTLGELGFHGRGGDDRLPAVDPLWFSEAVRDVDLATTATLVDHERSGAVSSEQIAVRADLVRAFLPQTNVTEEIARFPGGAVHLRTGAAYDAAGKAILLPGLPVPAFPCADPEPAVAAIVARALHLANVRP